MFTLRSRPCRLSVRALLLLPLESLLALLDLRPFERRAGSCATCQVSPATTNTACKTEQAAQFCLDDENKERDDATAVPSLCRPLALFAPTLCQLQACSNASAIGVLVAMAEGASLRIEKRVTLVLISRLD
jgi:hypothetical protein